MRLRRATVIALLFTTSVGCEATTSNPPEYATVSPVVESSCAHCHSGGGMDALITAVAALPPESFDSTSFPASDFHVGLRPFTTDDLAEEANISAGMPVEQAWIIHELNELDVLLDEEVPPDFTSEESLNAFALFNGGTYTEGCEILEKLELGRARDPEGMPPPWAASLMALLEDASFVEPAPTGRDDLHAYTEAVLGTEAECGPADM